MPKQNIDYSNTVIYKIVCKDLSITDIYIGHTTHFRLRKNLHKSVCSNEQAKHHDLNIYKIIREKGGWENWQMIEIEKYPCNDGNEARERERYWYEINQPTLNSAYPGRTSLESQKNYYQENKEQIKLWQKTTINCDCGGNYCLSYKAKHFKTLKHQIYINSI